MISYTKRYVNIVSLIITIVLYGTLTNVNFNPTSILNLLKKNIVQVEISSNNINQETKEEVNSNSQELKVENVQNNYPNKILSNSTETKQTEEKKWIIKIPVISLEAEISEGTSKEVMNKYVGHFDETSKTTGNVGLAAHNRGYEVNYFTNLKKLKEGDEIIYKYDKFEKKYLVTKHVIIKDTDWTYLEETKENTITLITCVENEPEYRRCIQGGAK